MISDEEHAKVVDLVYAHDYYIHIFNAVRKSYADRNMKTNTPYFWHDFWVDLPDTLAIRRAPFFQICDLAERIYDTERDM
jgi:hypothetical protein